MKQPAECKNCGVATGNVGEVAEGLCNLCAVAQGVNGGQRRKVRKAIEAHRAGPGQMIQEDEV